MAVASVAEQKSDDHDDYYYDDEDDGDHHRGTHRVALSVSVRLPVALALRRLGSD
jgi:hypothetical protein